MTSVLDGSTTRSGKYYETNLDGGRSTYNPFQEPTTNDPSVLSPPQTCKGKNLSEPPPFLDSDMVAHLKLPTFKGVGEEDMRWFWFLADSF